MSQSPERRLPKWVLPTIAVIAVIAFYTLLPLKQWLGDIADWITALGVLGVVLYLIGYGVATALFFPAALLSLIAGFAWGTFGGFAIAMPAILLGAVSQLLMSRYLFGQRFRTWLARRPKAAAIEQAVELRGPWLVFLLRFSPVVPYTFVNYAIGLTRLPVWQFAIATACGIVPLTFLYTYTGSIGRLLGTSVPMSTEQIVSLVVGLVVTAGVTLWVTLVARRALRGVVPERASA